MYPDDVIAEAVKRLTNGKNFIITNGDMNSIRFIGDPDYIAPKPAYIRAMCDEILKENELNAKHTLPPKPSLEEQLEYLWHDLNNNSLNKGGTFYKMLRPYYK